MPLQATSGAASYDAFGGGVAAVPNYIEDVFSTWLYTGTGSTQTITNGIDLAGKGGLVWLKQRSGGSSHQFHDTVRGAGNIIYSNLTNAQGYLAGTVDSFNSSGFSIGSQTSINNTSQTYASWTFRKQPKFFDVVTYTGDGGVTANVSHNLGSVPGAIFVKRTDAASEWAGWVRKDNTTVASYLSLNSTDGSGGNDTYSEMATATTFNKGKITNSLASTSYNINGAQYVAYLFAHDAGGFGLTGTDNVISCGSFTTNGSGLATVDLGYEPQYFLVKPSSNAGNWEVVDNMRGFNNAGVTTPTNASTSLFPNLSAAETYAGFNASINSNGFTFLGNNSWTYIYIAIRRGPMKVPTDGTKVFNPALEWTPNSNVMGYLGAPADFEWIGYRNGASINVNARTRLTGGNRLSTSSTAAEISDSTNYWDNQLGFNQTSGSPGTTYAMWTGRRAPGFMDVVCYIGDGGSNRALPHNLQAVPELVIYKNRSLTSDWLVWTTSQAGKGALLNTTDAFFTNGNTAGSSTWTSSTIYIKSAGYDSDSANGSGSSYVAYLFASCPGVSKVFSFTGNGSTQTINCGFAGGARFVLLKASSATGGWYVYDTARGMTTLTDPYLQLNSTAAESATLGSVTTVTTGFAVNESVLAGVNTNGVSYIGLAIA